MKECFLPQGREDGICVKLLKRNTTVCPLNMNYETALCVIDLCTSVSPLIVCICGILKPHNKQSVSFYGLGDSLSLPPAPT